MTAEASSSPRSRTPSQGRADWRTDLWAWSSSYSHPQLWTDQRWRRGGSLQERQAVSSTLTPTDGTVSWVWEHYGQHCLIQRETPCKVIVQITTWKFTFYILWMPFTKENALRIVILRMTLAFPSYITER